MLQQLPETGARRGRRLGWMVPSVMVHAAIITAVVFAPVKGIEAPPREEPESTVIYVAPETGEHVTGSTRSTGPSEGPPPTLPIPDMTSTSIPEPGTPTIWSAKGDSVGVEDIMRGGAGDALTSGTSSVRGEATVDEPVRVRIESVPRYPAQLRAAGIQGKVEMEFVVDTTGRVDISTIRVLSSPDDRFTAAVRGALGDARFVSGRYQNHPVRTLVRRAFEFRLEGLR